MGIPANSICDKTGNAADPKWLKDLDLAYDETIKLLGELEGVGHNYKRLSKIFLERCDDPCWDGQSKTDGWVHIQPGRHEARAIAHEMGHGFHEVWDDDDHCCCGESMAEAIRWFVEERMGEREWQPQRHRTCVLEACAWNWDKFKKELNGKIAELAKE